MEEPDEIPNDATNACAFVCLLICIVTTFMETRTHHGQKIVGGRQLLLLRTSSLAHEESLAILEINPSFMKFLEAKQLLRKDGLICTYTLTEEIVDNEGVYSMQVGVH